MRTVVGLLRKLKPFRRPPTTHPPVLLLLYAASSAQRVQHTCSVGTIACGKAAASHFSSLRTSGPTCSRTRARGPTPALSKGAVSSDLTDVSVAMT